MLPGEVRIEQSFVMELVKFFDIKDVDTSDPITPVLNRDLVSIYEVKIFH